MNAVTLRTQGDFKNTLRFLHKMKNLDFLEILDRYGKMGVERLAEYTPKLTGKTASSWTYEIHIGMESASIDWWNTNENDGVPIALIIQYGHGTGTFGYVPPIDYINPALQPVFKELADKVWKEVENA